MDWMVDCARSFFSMMQAAVEAAPVVAEIPAGIEVDEATGVAKAPATPSRAETQAKTVSKAKPTVRTKVSMNLDDYEEDEMILCCFYSKVTTYVDRHRLFYQMERK